MQVNFNSQQQNQNFGMAMRITDGAREVLRARRMPGKDIDRLGELIDNFAKRKVDIMIDKSPYSKKRLFGHVCLDQKYYKYFTEGYLNSLFKSPIKFIEKLCKHGNKVDGYYNYNKLDQVLNEKLGK